MAYILRSVVPFVVPRLSEVTVNVPMIVILPIVFLVTTIIVIAAIVVAAAVVVMATVVIITLVVFITVVIVRPSRGCHLYICRGDGVSRDL